jgi:uncharacterized membrane protein
MRINLWAAIGLGLLLPVLETVRRGFDHWSVNFTTMFEDYAAGACLLVAAAGSWLRASWAATWMVIIWSGTMFMLLISTVSQLERHFWHDDLEPRSDVVLAVKLVLFAISVVALVQSVRELRRDAGRR